MTKPAKFIGRSVPRLEDRPLLLGQGRFAADINFPGQWHMRVVRSPVAHGKLRKIDASAALKLPGVHAVWTYADVAHIPPIGFRLTGLIALEPYRQYALAQDYVRYVGEPVAAVFADDPYLAEDAADLVALDIEPLPVILDAARPPGPFDGERSTEATVIEKKSGDVEAALRAAHSIVELDLSIGRHSGVPLETRGLIARYVESTDVLEMYGAAKVPHWNRDRLALMFGRKPESVQLFEGHVGGGFGIRGEMYPEDLLVCAAALKFRKPIKWIEDRREHLIAANHSRQQRHKIRAAIDVEGLILGIEDEFFHDNGAYARTHAATVPDLAAAMLPGPYRVPAYRAVGHMRLTNKTPCGTYRSPGRYETTFVRERLIDAIAARTGIDAIEIRRRNLVPKSAMPYDLGFGTLGTRLIYDSGDYAKLMDKLLTAADWPAMQRDFEAPARRRRKGRRRFCHVRGEERARSVRQGAHRGGAERRHRGRHRRRLGRARRGNRAGADRRRHAGRRLCRHQGHARADRPHRQGPGRLRFARDGNVRRGNAAGRRQAARAGARRRRRADAGRAGKRSTSWTARSCAPTSPVPRCRWPRWRPRTDGLSAEAEFKSSQMVYPYGAHVVQLELDADTGGVTIERYLVAFDIGKAVNPMLVQGQIMGGMAQGLGGALYEEFLYAENGEPLSVSFADYLMPTAREVPGVEVIVTEDAPSPLNPLGVKGAGEGGITPVGAAIASAIDDALQRPGAVTQLPVTPQRLKALMAAD